MFEFCLNSGSSNSVVVIPYVICGVVLVLYILTVVVDVYKYQRYECAPPYLPYMPKLLFWRHYFVFMERLGFLNIMSRLWSY